MIYLRSTLTDVQRERVVDIGSHTFSVNVIFFSAKRQLEFQLFIKIYTENLISLY